MVQLPWSNFNFFKSIYKAFGPLLGVNLMCNKRNDHAPNNECADFFYICLNQAHPYQLNILDVKAYWLNLIYKKLS